MEFPARLEAPGVALRALGPADAPALLSFLADPLVYESTSADPWTRETVETFIEANTAGMLEGRWCRLGILNQRDTAICGSIGLFNVDRANARAEIGYDLSPEKWGRGIMTTAASLLLDWSFANGFNRIEATVMADNDRSAAVLRRLGFQQEGLLRQYKNVRGIFRDFSLWSVLATDQRPPTPPRPS